MTSGWLSQLAPDHAPPAATWWPPAVGWWIAAVLALLCTILYVRWLRGRRRAMRQCALRELKLIRSSDADGPAVARAVQQLMRRYAIAVFGPTAVAKLAGDAWLAFVIAEGGAALSGAAGPSLLVAAFGNHSGDDRKEWLTGAESFIRKAGVRRRGRRAK
jgi:hypothetical protein